MLVCTRERVYEGGIVGDDSGGDGDIANVSESMGDKLELISTRRS